MQGRGKDAPSRLESNEKVFLPNSERELTKSIRKYNDIISVLDKRIENIDNQKNLAQEARDRLLPKLMNGEIEVKN